MAHPGRVGSIALVAGAIMMAPALPAQPVYRCANSYSQTPCAGGATIDVDDSRSPAQKAQSDAATAQAVRSANQMEQIRLMQAQNADKASRPPAARSRSSAVNGATTKSERVPRNPPPVPFTAFAPAPDKRVAKKPQDTRSNP